MALVHQLRIRRAAVGSHTLLRSYLWALRLAHDLTSSAGGAQRLRNQHAHGLGVVAFQRVRNYYVLDPRCCAVGREDLTRMSRSLTTPRSITHFKSDVAESAALALPLASTAQIRSTMSMFKN
jgi:hypothetical protein